MGDNCELARRLLELTDRRDWPGREAMITVDCDFVTPAGAAVGRSATTDYSRPFAAAFADSRHIIEVVEDTGGGAVVEGSWVATHTGDLVTAEGTIPATGRPVQLRFAAVFGVRDGLVSSAHIYFDQLQFSTQLGLVPAPQAA